LNYLGFAAKSDQFDLVVPGVTLPPDFSLFSQPPVAKTMERTNRIAAIVRAIGTPPREYAI
jgi:hypothetical protein